MTTEMSAALATKMREAGLRVDDELRVVDAEGHVLAEMFEPALVAWYLGLVELTG